MSQDALTPARVTLVDVYVVRLPARGQVEALVLRRATGRSPGSWEAVHGHIEDGESPAEAAWREVIEEAGVTPTSLYNLSRVESFYLHRLDSVVLVPVFAAIIDPAAPRSSPISRPMAAPPGSAAGNRDWPGAGQGSS